MVLVRENQKKIKLNLNKAESRHFDYGYAYPRETHHRKGSQVIAYQTVIPTKPSAIVLQSIAQDGTYLVVYRR